MDKGTETKIHQSAGVTALVYLSSTVFILYVKSCFKTLQGPMSEGDKIK
jgi:hypothetical protein